MKTIELTDEQYQAFSNGETITLSPPKPKFILWQPKGGGYCVYGDSYIGRRSHDMLSEFTKFGSVYPTEEQAKKARNAMRTHNRLLAWLSENDDGWVADWGDLGQVKAYVAYSYDSQGFRVYMSTSVKTVSVVYMSEINALKLCHLLNTGAVEL